MKIERARFWRIVTASQNPNIIKQVKLGDMIEDPNRVLCQNLSEATKGFVTHLRTSYNKGKGKLFKQLVDSTEGQPVRYNAQFQASMYAEKLNEEERERFANETEWKTADTDSSYEWLCELVRNSKWMK